MYEVSADYLAAFRLPVHQKKMRGTVGSVNITQNNISSGTMLIHNQCGESADIKLGAVYIGTMECTFLNNTGIGRYSWKGKRVTLEEGLLVGSSYIYVPKGTWTIAEAKWNKDGVSVTAYDNMKKFVRPFPYTAISASSPIDILQMFCDDCHVENGMDNLNNFCNGNSIIHMTDQGDIETYQDALYWLAQALCAFATIDRTGKLVLRRFVSDTVDTIQNTARYNSSSFTDYSTRYTGVSVVDMSDNTTKYYAAETDDGSTINLGANPFLQSVTKDTLMGNILTEIQQIQYVPFSASMLDGAFYDLGDVIEHKSGIAGQTSACMIMYFDDAYNDRFEMRGFGADPGLSSAQSKSDKKIQGLLSSVDKNEFRDYEQKNTRKITISNNTEERILMAKLASNNTTKALIHLEINLESKTVTITDKVDVDVTAEQDEVTGNITASGEAEGSDIFSLVSRKTTKGIVRYLVNSEEAGFKPIEQWLDGNHVLHLMFVLSLYQGIPATFEVYMKAQGGNIEIPMGGMWFYGSGRGLVGDGKWDGSITVIDEVSGWALTEIAYASASDSVSIVPQTPTQIAKTEVANAWSISEISYESASDTIHITLRMDSRPRITEDGKLRITEDGSTRYTEGD